ncbi:LysR family transcriptional regulator [Pseudocolwellia agarivorans]|uniref:LysR family transcriptional regulator n=1 Tax=Pseudocolwellia agarivorans TaxID=1911682 RepID=UPI0009879F0C|nr:LysR family transcriptional regulator [Pseudocolwellia agarivorans]
MKNNLKLFDGMVLFTQVVNSGGFTAASLVNGHSTSFISKEINKLESRLGVRLLSRTTRKISLTPEGQAFYQQCEQMIIEAEQALGIINQANTEPKGVLKISCPIGYGMSHLQSPIAEYSTLYPDVKLDLDFNDRKVDVIQEGYDLAIRATQYLEDSSLVCKKIASYKAYTVASPLYLKQHGTPLKPEDLSTHKCLSYSNLKNPTKWKFETLSGEVVQVDVPATILCNNAEMELAMVLQNKGICRLPEFYMEKELKENKVVILFEGFKQVNIDIYALYPSRKHLSPKVRKFLDLLVKE